MKSFWSLINIINFDDFCFMFGYLIKLKHNVIQNTKTNVNTTTQYEYFFHQFNSSNKTHRPKSNFISRIRAMLNEHIAHTQTNHNTAAATTTSTEQDDPCYSNLHGLVKNYENSYEICQFLYEINVSETAGYSPVGFSKPKQRISQADYFVSSPVISFFLGCFTQSYLNKTNEIFDFNTEFVLTEMETCVNSGINGNNTNDTDSNRPSFAKLVDEEWNDYELFTDEEDENESYMNSIDNSAFGGPRSSLIVKEMASLSDDIKNLHRPNVDANDYIQEFPHLTLNKQKDIGKLKCNEIVA